MQKKQPGRKKIKLNDPDTLNKIIALGSQGLTSGQIARCLGVSWSTIDRRRKENADIEEAIKKGAALGVEKISNALMTSARDGNVTAQIFYLKNRAGWVDKTETKIHEERTVTLDLTRIGINELSAIERAFEQSNAGGSQGREIPQIIEGVYESRLADD